MALLTAVLVAPLETWAASINITGSTTLLPIAESIAKAYMETHKDMLINISGGGSGNGIKAIIDGTTDIGNSSRFIKPQEITMACGKSVYPVPFRIAYDCIVPVVHPDNPVRDLTLQQLKEIYLGHTTNWSEVGGGDLPIVVVSRDTSSGTYEVWEEKVMNKETVFPGATLVSSNEAVVKAVMLKKEAVGYIGLGYLDDSVRPIRVDGIKGTEATTLNGSYPISRPLFMFTRGWPSGELLAFINYVLDPDHGQKLVKKAGFVPLTQVRPSVEPSAVIPSPQPATAEVNTATAIRTAQRQLNDLHYDAGPIDGVMGEKTTSAVMAFQKAAGLPVDGRLTVLLLEKIADQHRKSRK